MRSARTRCRRSAGALALTAAVALGAVACSADRETAGTAAPSASGADPVPAASTTAASTTAASTTAAPTTEASTTAESSTSAPASTITSTSTASTTVTHDRATPTSAPVATPAPTFRPPASTTPDTTEPGTTPRAPEEGPTVSVFPEGDIHPGLRAYVRLAIADLAARLAVAEEDVGVVSAVLVSWPDGGLGCPEPGMQYTQVPQDGALIELRVGDRIHRYHAGGSRRPFPCERPLRTVPRRIG